MNMDKISIIPDDIIRFEILTRLPVKILMQFQCVCKSWQFLISRDPIFIKAHVARSVMDPSNDRVIIRCHPTLRHKHISEDNIFNFPLFVCSKVGPVNEFDYPLLSSGMVLAGSVNGLVCLYSYNDKSKSIPCIGIWNPATHRYKDVRPPLNAYNIKAGDFSFAFVFDSIKKDYKVIYIIKTRNKNKANKPGQVVADVYSCNARSWAHINVSSSFELENGELFKYAITVGNRVYWNYSMAYGRKHDVISFDIGHEVFRLFHAPDLLPNQKMATGNLNNLLVCLVHEYCWDKTTSVDVYALNETNGETWNKMYTVGPISLTRRMHIVQCFRNGDLFFSDYKEYRCLHFDPKTHALLRSNSHAFDVDCLAVAYGIGYTQTLVSVMGMKHIEKNDCERLLFIQS